MPAYMIVIGNNRNPDWLPDYVAQVPAILRSYGGEYVGVGKRMVQFEGTPLEPNLTAIFSFPSLDKIEAFMADDAYKPFADARKANMEAVIVAFDTED